MCLVHMNNKAAGSDWLGLHFAACVHQGLLPAWRSGSYWLETDRKCCLNIMKTQIWVYSFHNFSPAAAILFLLNTAPPRFSAWHTFQCKTLIGMRAPLHTPSAHLLSCLAFVFPSSLLCIPVPLCFNVVSAAGFNCWHPLERHDWTANDSEPIRTLHANICAKLYLYIVFYCLHPRGEKHPKVRCMLVCSFAANETIGRPEGIRCTD